MSDASPLDVDYVARLARIELTEEEKLRFGEQLGQILAFAKRLEEVDLNGVEPMAHGAPVFNVWDEDVAAEPLDRSALERNAPDWRDGEVVVPRVIEE